MDSNRHLKFVLVALTALVFGACAGGPPPSEPAPRPAPVAIEEPEPEPELAEPEPDPPLEERWNAPFAVSSAGRTIPREPRRVAVIGADAALADALAELRGGPAVAAADEPGRGTATSRRAADPETDRGTPASADRDRDAAPVRSGSNESDAPAEDRDARRTHRVGPGDTLWGIARRYNITPDQIREANDLSEDRVRLGQILVIPIDDGS